MAALTAVGGGEDPAATESSGPQGPPEGEGDIQPVIPGLVDYLNFWMNPDGHSEKGANETEQVHPLGDANHITFGHTRKSAVANVEDGALQLIAALLAGFPRSGYDASFEKWQSAAATLDGAVAELGIWRSWSFGDRRRNRANAYLLGRVNALLHPHPWVDLEDATIAAHHLLVWPLFSRGRSISIDDYLKHQLHYWHPWPHGGLVASHFPTTERYESLFTWPVPTYVQQATGIKNVGQLLTTFVCSPGSFVGKPHAMLDIVGFAAALLGSRTEDRTGSNWQEKAAANWLVRSMPRYRFGRDAELAILHRPPNFVNAEVADGQSAESSREMQLAGASHEEIRASIHDRKFDGSPSDRGHTRFEG